MRRERIRTAQRRPAHDRAVETRGVPLAIDGTPVDLHIRVFAHFVARARGLLGCDAARYVDGVRLEPCRAIHTMGMSRSIDVVFVDEVGRVLRVAAELPPWRVATHATARAVYELPAGAAARYGIGVGGRLALWQDGAAR